MGVTRGIANDVQLDPSLQHDRSSVGSTLLSPSSENKGPPGAAGDPASILAAALANRKTKVAASGTPPNSLNFTVLYTSIDTLQMMKTRAMIGIKLERIALRLYIESKARTLFACFSGNLDAQAWNSVCFHPL